LLESGSIGLIGAGWAITNRQVIDYILVRRIAALVIVALGVVFAFWVKMGIAFWLGLIWRKTTTAGAWAGTITGFATWWLLSQSPVIEWFGQLPVADSLRLTWEGKIYEPWVILLYMIAAISATVLVSFFTKPTPESDLNRYYSLTRTPITDDEIIGEPCTLPVGVESIQRPMLFQRFGFEIPTPSKTSVLGFLAGWIAVAILIGGFVRLVN